MSQQKLSIEKKAEIIKQAKQLGVSKASLIYGINRTSIYNWLKNEDKILTKEQKGTTTTSEKNSFYFYVKEYQTSHFSFILFIKDLKRELTYITLLKEKTNFSILISLDYFFSIYQKEELLNKATILIDKKLSDENRKKSYQQIADKFNLSLKPLDVQITKEHISFIEFEKNQNQREYLNYIFIDLFNYNFAKNNQNQHLQQLFKTPLIIAENYISHYINQKNWEPIVNDLTPTITESIKIINNNIKLNRYDILNPQITSLQFKIFAEYFKNNQNLKEELRYICNYAHTQYKLNNVNEAVEIFTKTLKRIPEKSKYYDDLIYIYRYLNIIYSIRYDRQKLSNTIKKFLQIATLSKRTNDIIEAKLHQNYVLYNDELTKTQVRKNILLKALGNYTELLVEIKDLPVETKNKHTALILNNMGNILTHTDYGNFEKAIDCYKESINYSDTNSIYLAYSYNNLSLIYAHTGQFKKAIESLNKYKTISKTLNEHLFYADAEYKLGEIYLFQDKFSIAIEHFNKAEKIFIQNQAETKLVYLYLRYASLYTELSSTDIAQLYLDKINQEVMLNDCASFNIIYYYIYSAKIALRELKYKKAITLSKKALEYITEDNFFAIEAKLFYHFTIFKKELSTNIKQINFIKIKSIISEIEQMEQKYNSKKHQLLLGVVYYFKWKILKELQPYKKFTAMLNRLEEYQDKAKFNLSKKIESSYILIYDMIKELENK